MPSHDMNIVLNTPSGQVTHTKKTITSDLIKEFDLTLTGPQTDYEIDLALVVANVKSFYILTTADCTIETNSGSSPANTLSLKAQEPYHWYVGSPHGAFKLTTNVTALFVTKAGSGDFTLKLRSLEDATPA